MTRPTRRRRPPAPPVTPVADEAAALRALLRPYRGRALPDDDDLLLSRARSALRQAGLSGSLRAARELLTQARTEAAESEQEQQPGDTSDRREPQP